MVAADDAFERAMAEPVPTVKPPPAAAQATTVKPPPATATPKGKGASKGKHAVMKAKKVMKVMKARAMKVKMAMKAMKAKAKDKATDKGKIKGTAIVEPPPASSAKTARERLKELKHRTHTPNISLAELASGALVAEAAAEAEQERKLEKALMQEEDEEEEEKDTDDSEEDSLPPRKRRTAKGVKKHTLKKKPSAAPSTRRDRSKTGAYRRLDSSGQLPSFVKDMIENAPSGPIRIP